MATPTHPTTKTAQPQNLELARDPTIIYYWRLTFAKNYATIGMVGGGVRSSGWVAHLPAEALVGDTPYSSIP